MSKKRREKGEGSVYRRKDGRCVGEYEDANGKRRYVSGKTKAEVRAKLRKLLADRDEGVAYDSENLAVGGYLDRWLGALEGSLRDRTWRRHEEVVGLLLAVWAFVMAALMWRNFGRRRIARLGSTASPGASRRPASS